MATQRGKIDDHNVRLILRVVHRDRRGAWLIPGQDFGLQGTQMNGQNRRRGLNIDADPFGRETVDVDLDFAPVGYERLRGWCLRTLNEEK